MDEKNKKSMTINGWFMWSRTHRGNIVFARQLEPTHKEPFGLSENRALMTPILVGYEGQDGIELDQLLDEYKKLKEDSERVKSRHFDSIVASVQELAHRVDSLEAKKWWEFWK